MIFSTTASICRKGKESEEKVSELFFVISPPSKVEIIFSTLSLAKFINPGLKFNIHFGADTEEQEIWEINRQ